MTRRMKLLFISIWSLAQRAGLMLLAISGSAGADDLTFKERALKQVIDGVPSILKTYNPATGRFGSGPFVVRDQHPLLPLAVAYSTPSPRNPYYKNPSLLDVLMSAGDALIAAQDRQGRWRYDKKDGSYWGQVYMPWTYSRWVRSFVLIKDDMPADRRQRWHSALSRGFQGISLTGLAKTDNMAVHNAMALYVGGKVLARQDWQQEAANFMAEVVARQREPGYWSEHSGPVVRYNHVYVEAIGIYYAESRDPRVLPALEKAAKYHLQFTYPDGRDVETIDERSVYQDSVTPGAGNVGFTMTQEGRAYLAKQWRHNGARLGTDAAASFVLHGEEGPLRSPTPNELTVTVEEGMPRAAVLASGPWFIVLSAYTAQPSGSRWIQDRQNVLSIWRAGHGLIAGGGNTKLQPRWSTFTVGDLQSLAHSPGDESPSFTPSGELYHTPSSAILLPGDSPQLLLTYGTATAHLKVRPASSSSLGITYSLKTSTALPTAAHLQLLPQHGAAFRTAEGYEGELGDQPIELDPTRLGSWLSYRGICFALPAGTTFHWPVLPHNPYRKDGRALSEEGRIELRIPLKPDGTPATVLMEATSAEPPLKNSGPSSLSPSRPAPCGRSYDQGGSKSSRRSIVCAPTMCS